MKRYDLSTIYTRQDTGGHPKEELSAQMDIVCDARHAAGQGEILEAEVIWAAGQVVKGALGQPYVLRLNSVNLTVGTLELLDVPHESRRPVLAMLEAINVGAVTQPKAVATLLDNVPSLGKTPSVKEGVRTLLTRLLGTEKDPLAALQAIEDVLSALPQVQAVLLPPGPARPQHYSRKELKRLRQACKSVSEALFSLRTLLHYLHALGMLPLVSLPKRGGAAGSGGASAGGHNGGTASTATSSSSSFSTTPNKKEVDSSSSFSMSPKEPTNLMETSLRGPKGVGPLECGHAPVRVSLDLGLYRRKSAYNSGLIFQLVVLPPKADVASSMDETDAASRHAILRYQRYCVVEGGRYDGLILEHRSPAQWALPLVLAAGMTVNIEKLTAMALQPAPSSTLGSGSSLNSMASLGELLPLSLEVSRRSSSCAGPPDALICSTGSGLGAGGMTDRLLVACALWTRGVKADYLAQDLWASATGSGGGGGGGGRGGTHRGGAGGGGVGVVELSVEEATRICLALGVPFLVMVKAHVLREKQAVKLRAVRDVNVPDVTVPLQQLARHIIEKLQYVGGSHHLAAGRGVDTVLLPSGASLLLPLDAHGHHHHHHAASGTTSGGGVEVNLACLDTRTTHAAGSDRRKAYKEVAALERRVRSHLEGMVGHPFPGSGHQREPVTVLAVELPYMLIRIFCTAYLRLGAEEALQDPLVGQLGGAHKRSLKLLAEALKEEERRYKTGGHSTPSGRKGGGGGGGTGGMTVYVYSVVEDCVDVVPLGHVGGGGRGGSGGGGGPRRGGEKR